MKLTFYFVMTPKRRSLRAWITSGVIRWFEGKSYNHVFAVGEDESKRSTCWNIFSWRKPWSEYEPQGVIDAYDTMKSVELEVTSEEYTLFTSKLNSLVGRHYAVGRLLLIPLYRVTRWDFLTKLPGVTCTNGVARGLQSAGLWKCDVPPEMAGLDEVEEVVDRLRVTRDASPN